jgi:hypothetical protein
MKTIEKIVGYILGFIGLVVFIVIMCIGKLFLAIGAYIDKLCGRFVAAVCGF